MLCNRRKGRLCYESDEVVLLITGCIAPDTNQSFLVLKDKNARLEQYVSSIKYYIENSQIQNIVFCDNSNYPYTTEELRCFSKHHGKNFEWLSFQGDSEKTVLLGKGYGEGEIIDYALENSKLLQKAATFAKVTGRLKIRNINEAIRNKRKEENYFLRDIFRGHAIDTRFYMCDKEFYNRNLRKAFRNVNAEKPRGAIEDVFYMVLNPLHCHSELNVYPDFEGTSGGNGIDYSKTPRWKIALYSFLCRIRMFNSAIVAEIAVKKLKLVIRERRERKK